MAGGVRKIDDGGLSVTETRFVQHASGTHGSASFFWQLGTVTGTWDVALYAQVAGIDVKIAELTGITSAGYRRIPLVTGFAATRQAIPEPVKIIFTEAVAGTTLASRVYAVYGD